jgi:tetratricopeptide (TPR) repeat protein
MYLNQGEDSLALAYFDKSLQTATIDRYTEIQNYQELVRYYFENGSYIKTGQYLDRLLSFFDPSSTRYKQLSRQRENLSDVIIYEKTVKETDSILKITALSYSEQLDYFQAFIDQKLLLAKNELEAKEDRSRFQLLGRSSSSFYFYNSNLILQGKQNFLTRWGTRPNIDNWRSALAIENINQVDEVSVENVTLKPRIIQETPENFVASLPQSEEERDSIKRLNHRAYIQLGIIYKEKFKNYPLAEERLINLISLEPSDELKVKALYHLFRMASTQNAPLAAVYKSTLLEEYPETAFAQLISDPENFDNSQLITPKVLYKDILDLFQKQKFAEAREAIEPLMILASGSSIEPKAALLKAHINGRLNGVEAWKSALADVISTYSASEEAKNAKALTEEIEAFDNLKESGVVYKNYKWIFPFLSSETKQSKAFFEEIKATLQIVKQRWKVSLDTFNEEYVFVVVHGIRDPQEVKNIETEVGLEELIQRNTDNFVALASQYRTILKNKNWKTPKNERIRD